MNARPKVALAAARDPGNVAEAKCLVITAIIRSEGAEKEPVRN